MAAERSGVSEPSDRKPRRDARVCDTLTFRVLVAANRIARPFPERIGERYDLTLPEWRAMMVLAGDPGASGEVVAQTLATDKMSVSRALRRLLAAGRVERRAAAGRRNAWQLSEAGWDLFDRIAPLALERDRALLGDLDEESSLAIRKVFERLAVMD